LVMKDGVVEAQGTAEELLQTSPLFRQIWEGDTGESQGEA
ncbi:hypothetical protein PA598K_07270, partial [Paenibacillus sp. 598K]